MICNRYVYMNIHKLSAQNADLLLDLQFYTLYKLRVVVQPRGKFLKIFTDVSVVSLHETINMCAKMKTKEKMSKTDENIFNLRHGKQMECRKCIK